MPPRTFTLAEANALLPRIEAAVTEIRDRKQRLDALRTQSERVAALAQGNGHAGEPDDSERRAEAERLLDELNTAIARVRAFGCEVKDLDMGLIDFPHEREGRIVYLCWRPGEPEVAWWHEVHTGFFARKPI